MSRIAIMRLLPLSDKPICGQNRCFTNDTATEAIVSLLVLEKKRNLLKMQGSVHKLI